MSGHVTYDQVDSVDSVSLSSEMSSREQFSAECGPNNIQYMIHNMVIPHLDVGQYLPNIRETISNSDLNASNYLYIVIPHLVMHA